MTKKLGFKALVLVTGLGLSVVLVSGCNPERARQDHESFRCAAGGRQACAEYGHQGTRWPRRKRTPRRSNLNSTPSSGPAGLDCGTNVGRMGCISQAGFPDGNPALLAVRPGNSSAPTGLTLHQDESASL